MKRSRIRKALSLFGAGAVFAVCVSAQTGADTVNAHMAAASKAAGFDHIGIYNTTCARLGDPAGGRAAPVPNDRDASVWTAPPAKVFDNLYWLGEHAAQESHPSAWAVDTSGGILLIDALFNNSVQQQVVGGLQKMGLDPKRIKYVLLTHAHADHYGGAKYLQDTYGAHVMMSAADWDFLESQRPGANPKPARDIVVTDGQKFTLGDTTITMYITPGHTPGTISFLLPVTDRGQPHLAAMWGGTGWSFSRDDPASKKLAVFRQYHDSAVRFREIVANAGADVVLGNHSYLDLAEQKNTELAKRGPNDPNPWVLGKERALNYENVAVECSAAGLASFR
jgi:metallo-beta-lactamase class B